MGNTFKIQPVKNKCITRKDCHQFLYGCFYDYGEFRYWKSFLSLILKNAILDTISLEGQSTGSILFFGSNFQKLLYASNYLFLNHHSSPIPDPDWSDLLDNRALSSNPSIVQRIPFLPFVLKPIEMQNPKLFLNRFYNQKSIKAWSKLWNTILDYSLCNDSIIQCIETENISDMDSFHGLLEACYLIFIRDFCIETSENHENN